MENKLVSDSRTLYCLVSSIFINAKGRDVLDIGLSGFHNKSMLIVKFFHELISVNSIILTTLTVDLLIHHTQLSACIMYIMTT